VLRMAEKEVASTVMATAPRRISPMSVRTIAVSTLVSLALLCLPVTAAEYAGTLVKVPLDIDVYDKAGGEGKKRPGFVKGGSQVYLLKQRPDHWCKVQGDAVPGGPGWIWCGKGDDGQDYSVTPVTDAGMPPPDTGDGKPPVEPNGGDGKPASKSALLNAHNNFRAKHCVPAMTWSDSLAASAQQWASGCKMNGGAFVHSGVPGENLRWSSPPGGQGDGAVTASWYNEIGNYNFNNPGFSPATGHFTQVVWAGSTQLGCAKAVCGNFDYWVCRYSPAGNITGQFPANVKPLCK
jgi:glioma pathogenesis-related protein 2